jgi:hypothetical protein
VGEAGQIAQHHAEAVVQRHGDAQAVLGREPHAFANEETVVQDVAVRQRRALGEARGAAGELDVDGIGVLQRGRDLVDARILGMAFGQQIRKRTMPGWSSPSSATSIHTTVRSVGRRTASSWPGVWSPARAPARAACPGSRWS